MAKRPDRHSQGEQIDAAVARDFEGLPPVLTPEMVSKLVYHGGVSVKTLSKWRGESRGPRFRRQGHPTRGSIAYFRSDLVAYFSGLKAAAGTLEERERVARFAA